MYAIRSYYAWVSLLTASTFDATTVTEEDNSSIASSTCSTALTLLSAFELTTPEL